MACRAKEVEYELTWKAQEIKKMTVVVQFPEKAVYFFMPQVQIDCNETFLSTSAIHPHCVGLMGNRN